MADVRLDLIDPSRARIARELEALIDGEVRFDRHDRMLYATDASIYQVEPIGVVIPRHREDVEAVVRYCAERGLPILPRGGGTSLAGQCVNHAVVIDMARHVNRVLSVDGRAATASVEPGVVLDRLNEMLAPRGLMFGPDVATSSHCNIGGMIGNNSAGVHSILYGRTVDNLCGLDVLLADGSRLQLSRGAAADDGRVADVTRSVAEVILPLAGEIDERFPSTLRRVNGYNLDLILDQLRRSTPGTFDEVNLAHLFCGSEGTLGVTLEAKLSLVPTPAGRSLSLVGFADVDASLDALPGILETSPAAVELIDDMVIELARRNAETRQYVPLLPAVDGRTPDAVLYVEYFGTEEELDARVATLERRFGTGRVQTHRDQGAMACAWKLRKAGEPLLHGRPGDRKPITFIEDLAVEPAKLAAFVREFREIVDAHGTHAAYYAHASVGCLHLRPLIDLRDDADLGRVRSIAEQATDLVMRYGGALSGEHGDGRLRSHLLQRFYGPRICDAFKRIRAIFDPDERLNPGNITGPPEMLESLRYRPGTGREPVHVPDVKTFYSYRREHGLDEAVQRCNGAGVCRRTSGGTMCPSYHATLDERHTTRGRGNALRLAMTGQLPGDHAAPVWNDPETLATLDLCLSCKACKTECPSNVDMAKLKSEYLAHSYAAAGGAPRRVRWLGDVRELSRRASAVSPLANLLAGSAPIRSVLNRVMGLDPRRTLPRVQPSLYRWFTRRPAAVEGPAVILWPDCFSVYQETSVGRAAVEVLEAFGYRVVLPPVGCCGRPQISTGLLEKAVSTAAGSARQLAAAVKNEQAVAVVGLEPSCVSAIIDDWPDLELDVPMDEVRRLVEATVPIETFIESRWGSHPRRPGRAPSPEGPGLASTLLHGHCHEKSLWGTTATESLLGRFLDAAPITLDSGCCGMAGAFGYTADHYDLSMTIAELSLLPAIRERPEATVVASGTSCRHQIRDGVGREALHPIELIAARIG